MKKFSDNIVLKQYIEENNVSKIKEELINTVIFLLGNRSEIQNAINEVLNKTSFSFDEHQEISYNNSSSKQLLYSEIKYTLLKDNYSKERLNELIDVYHEAFNDSEEKDKKIEDNTDTKTSYSNENKNNSFSTTLKIIGGVVLVAIIGYIIYKSTESK